MAEAWKKYPDLSPHGLEGRIAALKEAVPRRSGAAVWSMPLSAKLCGPKAAGGEIGVQRSRHGL
jgi:hypothetical protein